MMALNVELTVIRLRVLIVHGQALAAKAVLRTGYYAACVGVWVNQRAVLLASLIIGRQL